MASPPAIAARGFSGMKFKAIATKDRAEFDQWVAKAKQSPNTMNDMAAFEKVAMPSEYNKVEYFSSVKPDLFKDVINKFMGHGKSMDMTQPEGEHSSHERNGRYGHEPRGIRQLQGLRKIRCSENYHWMQYRSMNLSSW